MRTHYCGQIDERLAGETVSVAGWVHRRRDHGGVIFVDLRDREGLLQVVFDPDAEAMFVEAEKLRHEFVVCVTGQVRERPAGTQNAGLASGQVELLARELELLNRSEPLPFQLDEQASEEVRLRTATSTCAATSWRSACASATRSRARCASTSTTPASSTSRRRC